MTKPSMVTLLHRRAGFFLVGQLQVMKTPPLSSNRSSSLVASVGDWTGELVGASSPMITGIFGKLG